MGGWGKGGAMAERAAEARDAAPIVVRCLRCPWTFRGSAGEAREAAVQHRRAEHPELPETTPRRNRNRSALCKVDDCGHARTGGGGRYAALCEAHREEARAAVEAERDERRGQRAARARAAPRPKEPTGRITPERLAEAKRLYLEERRSLIEIGRLLAASWGYVSPASCANQLGSAFKREGIELRPGPGRGRGSGGRPRRPITGRPSLITPARLDAAARLFEAGCSFGQIAHVAWERWGYANENACKVAIGKRFKRAGVEVPRRNGPYVEIPLVSRAEAVALLAEADARPRPPSPLS